MAAFEDDDEKRKLDEEALMGQLGGGPFADTPASTTMPVGGGPEVLAAPTAPAPRRGSFNNINLDAPTQRNINQFSGFNDDRALSGGDDDSVKDSFRRWAGGLDFDLKGKSKDQIGEYFRSQMGNAKDNGIEILDVKGEKMLINTKERGPEWIDAVQDAGGTDPRFAWQSEFDNIGQAALEPNRLQAAPTALADTSGPSAQDEIMAEVQALINGGNSQMDEQALMQLLNGAQI
jgi:hypothetical protein